MSFNRRQFAAGAGLLAVVSRSGRVLGADADGISETNAAIRQEVSFAASPDRVYRALTETAQFAKVTALSGAANSGMALGAAPTAISPDVGGAFTLFGGYISGRHIELVPATRIVQAWRTRLWDPGVFSIARFALAVGGKGTLLVFDHTGFPDAEAPHLAAGWHMNYWEPLAKYLG